MISVSDYPEPPQDNGEPRYLVYDKIMISARISLLVAFLVFLLYVYARWFSGRFFRRTRRRSASTGARFYFSGEEPERLWNVGLDSAIDRETWAESLISQNPAPHSTASPVLLPKNKTEHL